MNCFTRNDTQSWRRGRAYMRIEEVRAPRLPRPVTLDGFELGLGRAKGRGGHVALEDTYFVCGHQSVGAPA